MYNLMATQTDYIKLIDLLDKAEKLASELHGGYSGQFLSAEEFHQALFNCINKFKQATKLNLPNFTFGFYRHLVGTILLEIIGDI